MHINGDFDLNSVSSGTYITSNCRCNTQFVLIIIKMRWIIFFAISLNTGRIQILVLTNCQAISTEIGTDS